MNGTNVKLSLIVVLIQFYKFIPLSPTDSPRQVIDTNSTEIHSTRQQLLSLTSRQSDLSYDVISHLKDPAIGYRLSRVRSSRGGKRKEQLIKVCAVDRSVPRSHPIALSPGNSDPSSPCLPRSRDTCLNACLHRTKFIEMKIEVSKKGHSITTVCILEIHEGMWSSTNYWFLSCGGGGGAVQADTRDIITIDPETHFNFFERGVAQGSESKQNWKD